jgi:flagellar basal-body rod modification protein FlgD
MSYLPPVNAPDTFTTAADTAKAATAGSRTLSQNDFLNLLIAQMKAQDPLNPQSNTEMAAQMAQFTSLQQSGTMSNNIATMLTQQQVLQANSMLGGTVTLQVDAKNTATGVVQAVQMNGGVPKIVVNNTAYDLNQVLTLAPTVVTPGSTTGTSGTGGASESPTKPTPPTDRGYAAP